MKITHFTPCVSRPRYALGYSVTSDGKKIIVRVCEGGPVLRKDWGLPNGR